MDRRAGIALWRQIAESVEADIVGGAAPPGSRLPTEAELAARFGVNRHTVRRAMEELERRSLVRIEQGRGSFVTEDVLDYQIGPRTRFSEIVARQNREPSGQLLRAVEMPADDSVAAALGVRRGRSVFLIERVGMVDGRPVAVSAHYFPAQRVPGLLDAYARLGSITAALREAGVPDYFRKTTRITARMPTAQEAQLLRQPQNRPLLVAEAVNVDAKGAVIEFGQARYAAGRVQLVVEF